MSLSDNISALIAGFVRRPKTEQTTVSDALNIARVVQEVSESAGTSTLQQVTDAGSTTTNSITANSFIDANGPVKPYKVYSAIFNQSGTSNPSVNVLENTFGQTFNWTRSDAGIYGASLAGNPFTAGKTVVLQESQLFLTTASFYIFSNNTTSAIDLQTINSTTSLNEDDLLVDIYIEIRVYN